MSDIRLRLINFLLLSVAYGVASLEIIPIVLLSAFIFALIFKQSFVRNFSIIMSGSVAILVIAGIAWLLSSEISIFELSMNYLRWISLIVIAVVFFGMINLFEFVSALRFFKVPARIAIAFGIGLRFLPVLVEESKRVVQIQRKNGLKFSIATIRKGNLMNFLNKVLSPILVSILRRADSISLSVVIQQIEFRIIDYRFKPVKISDWLSLVFCLIILTLSILNFDIVLNQLKSYLSG